MKRLPPVSVAATFAAALAVAVALAPSAQAATAVQVPIAPVILPIDVPIIETAQVDDPGNGSTYVGGRYGAQSQDGTCAQGTQAFLEKRASDGSLLWQRYEDSHPDPVCTARPGSSLFAGVTSFAPSFVAWSSVEDLAVDPWTGDLVVVGEVRLAWADGGGARVTGSGAFVLVLSPSGGLRYDRFYGPVPGGPSRGGQDCGALCDNAGEGGGDLFGARGVALAPNGDVVVTGWHRPAVAGPHAGYRDYFLARLSSDLAIERCLYFSQDAGEDTGLAVVTDAFGRPFVTGYGGATGRDLMVARHDAAACHRTRHFQAGDVLDDAGTEIFLDGGDVVVRGSFNGELTVGPDTLGDPGGPQQGFAASFDVALQPLSAEIRQASAVPLPSSAPISGPTLQGASSSPRTQSAGGGSTPGGGPGQGTLVPGFDLVDLEVLEGEIQGGGLPQLDASDDDYLRVTPSVDNHKVRLRFVLKPHAVPGEIQTARLEVASFYCYRAVLRVRRPGISGTLNLGERDICSGDEPVLVGEFTPEQSAALGFDGVTTPDPDEPLWMTVVMVFPEPTLCRFCASPEQDASVDQFEVEM